MNSRSRNSLFLQAPAKINLFLKVLHKRLDGFHEIETIFERIDLCDDILIKSNNTGVIKIQCNHPQVPVGPKNLAYKVASLIQKDFRIKKGVDIHIHKRIPVAAGLAGGSTNAATVLLGLNRLWQLKLSQKDLVVYAKKIGSDVAFFLYDYSWGLGTGRGEKIKPLDVSTKLWHVIVVPSIKIYSGKVYEGLKLKPMRANASRENASQDIALSPHGTAMKMLTKRNTGVNILLRQLRKNDFNGVSQLLRNDLEPEIIRQCPRLKPLKQRLNSFGIKGVMISGSGPSVYGITHSEREARQVASVLSRRFSQVFVAKTL